MKKIGLTQRVEVIADYNERRDCLDQNWHKLLLQLGYFPVMLPNIQDPEVIAIYLKELELNGVILTGGNDLGWTQSDRAAIERDFFETALLDYCCSNLIPTIGVCRGMQMVNIYFGGTLTAVKNHVCPNHSIKMKNGKQFEVNSFHDWGISQDDLATQFEPLAYSKDGLIEYCKHKKMPITGMMWHPERPNQDHEIGLNIIKETFL